jgi:hypothetical protein
MQILFLFKISNLLKSLRQATIIGPLTSLKVVSSKMSLWGQSYKTFFFKTYKWAK